MSEAKIQNNILCFLFEAGLSPWRNETVGLYNEKSRKFRSLGGKWSAKGSPDIFAILPGGKFLAIEVKSKTGRPSRYQLDFIARIQKFGGIAFISRSVEQTYDQLVQFYPELENHRHLLKKYAFYDAPYI